MTDIIINPPQQYLYSKMSAFSPNSCCTDKTKFMNIIYACKHICYHYYNIFLRALFINFYPYYYKPSKTVFILKNVWFLFKIRVVQIKQRLLMYFKHM